MASLKLTLTVNFFRLKRRNKLSEIFIATWFQFNAHKHSHEYDSINCRAAKRIPHILKRVMLA